MQHQNSEAVGAPTSLPRMESVSRLSKIPIVESAWGVATGLYEKVKGCNRMVSWTLNHAEVVSTTALVPVASRLATPLHAVDNILCKGIGVVEEKVPAIKMPPRQMLDSTREYVVAGLGLNEPQGPDAPAAKRIIGAGVGVATAALQTAVSAAEWCMDRYLLSQQGEDLGGEEDKTALVPAKKGSAGAKDDPKDVLLRLQRVTHRLQLVTHRLQRHLVRLVSAQLKSLKQQQEDAKSYVGGVAQYISSVVTNPKTLASNVSAAWAEMAEKLQSEEGEDKDQRYVRVVARRFARRVVVALEGARGTVVGIEGGIFSSINTVTEYGRLIFAGLLNGSSKKVEDPSNGHNSEERAKLLCMRQEKGTSPPQKQPVNAVTTADKESSTEDETKTTSVTTKNKISESIAVAN